MRSCRSKKCKHFLINKLSHHFKKQDPKEIVIDEFFGQSIPLILIWPILINYGYIFTNFKIQSIIVIFILFRFFDIYILEKFMARICDCNYITVTNIYLSHN